MSSAMQIRTKTMGGFKYVDVGTGEVLSTDYPQVRGVKEPAYCKWYVSREFFDAVPMECLMLFARLLMDADYDGRTRLTDETLKEMQAKGYGLQVVRNKLWKLHKLGWLSKKGCGKGVYIVNPYLFARGKWSHISELRDYVGAPSVKNAQGR